jgi:hypothetical protein
MEAGVDDDVGVEAGAGGNGWMWNRPMARTKACCWIGVGSGFSSASTPVGDSYTGNKINDYLSN